MPRVYVSIGSNVEREKNVRSAVRALSARFPNLATSSVYESKADGFDGANFYNLAVSFETDAALEELREQLAAIEVAHGRARAGPRYAPRTLDIDILLYGALIRHDGRFDVPRHEIATHAYVLGPLAELAPEVAHPETGERFADLWRRRASEGATLRKVALELK